MIYEATLERVKNGWIANYKDGSSCRYKEVIQGNDARFLEWLAEKIGVEVKEVVDPKEDE